MYAFSVFFSFERADNGHSPSPVNKANAFRTLDHYVQVHWLEKTRHISSLFNVNFLDSAVNKVQ